MWDRKKGEGKSLSDLVKEEQQKEPTRRLNVEVPVSLHRQLRQRSLDEDVLIRDIVIRAIRKELGTS